MKCCWRPCEEDRPSFTDLRKHLENILQQDTPYLDLDLISLGVIDEETDDSHSSDSLPSFEHLELREGQKSREQDEDEGMEEDNPMLQV